MQTQTDQKTLLFDGKFFLYKSLNANNILTFNDFTTTTYYNFLNSIRSVSNKFKTNKVTIMWDSEFSYRKGLFPAYKQKDIIKDDNLQMQLKYIDMEYKTIKKLMSELGFASYISLS